MVSELGLRLQLHNLSVKRLRDLDDVFRVSKMEVRKMIVFLICTYVGLSVSRKTFPLLWECIKQDDSTTDTYVCEMTHQHSQMVTFTLCLPGGPPEAPTSHLIIRNWMKTFTLISSCSSLASITLSPQNTIDCMRVPSIVLTCVSTWNRIGMYDVSLHNVFAPQLVRPNTSVVYSCVCFCIVGKWIPRDFVIPWNSLSLTKDQNHIITKKLNQRTIWTPGRPS